ncbi:flagellar M-ring protein FliF [Sphingomonas sanguinis]|uniref:flagellar basal-body MS-ring/collar protein FliF n=1 Tax=Sphingomonas sanguinis TaxID=33051 RepID=UPI001C581986|nr:flagellar basal-body MS-ring/collar protein FliF [Sphingomonas sanguinis]QXT34448.1 flagellar M-ring protein FliF [Sphingomonas sanguinis]
MSEGLPSRRRQWMVIGGVFAGFVVLLGAGYYWFLSGHYTVLADHVRPGEAAAIVAELDKRGTAYELKDGGTTVLVPSAEADATRLALVRSDAAASGQIGFELFNKSDMGLTNFAQKINYQRALQGELVRTIMLMDGVETARVHLALPERALFRDDRTEPSAAVTVQMRGATAPDAAMVAGIQRLVSASVSDLPAARVVVLDAEGRVVSPAAMVDAPQGQDRSVEGGARAAVEQYYRARARAAVEAARPDLRYQLRVLALPQADGVVDPARWTPGETGAGRNFRLRMTIVTPAPIDQAAQDALAAAIRPAAALDDAAGDELVFETGPMIADSPAPAVADQGQPRRIVAPVAPVIEPVKSGWEPWWLWASVAALIAIVLAARFRPQPARDLSTEEQEAFAQTLRRQLALTDGDGHAAR